MVDLKAKPFYLKDEDIAWIEKAIRRCQRKKRSDSSLSTIFTTSHRRISRLRLTSTHVGGARYSPLAAEKIYDFTAELQRNSKIPMLIASNCDTGGLGTNCLDGTYIATAAQVEATGSEQVAYNVGYVSGREASAIGCNWVFNPIADILYNWRNTIVNTRAYGTNPDDVIKYTSNYIKGLRQSNVASCAKHFPGDGVEERDQHLLLGVNDMSPEAWDASFGRVYKHLIDEGVMSIMVGHIALPEYQKKLVPGITYQEIMPATLAPELLKGLLRGQLGFNGLLVTDASHMIGYGKQR